MALFGEEFFTNPTTQFAMNLLGSNPNQRLGPQLGGAYNNTFNNLMIMQQMQMRRNKEKREEKEAQRKYQLMLAQQKAAQDYARSRGIEGDFSKMSDAITAFKAEQPTSGVRELQAIMSPMGQELLARAGLSAKEYLRRAATSITNKVGKPGTPAEPIKAEDQYQWVNKDGTSLADENIKRAEQGLPYIGTSEAAFSAGYSPRGTKGSEEQKTLATTAYGLGRINDLQKSIYEKTTSGEDSYASRFATGAKGSFEAFVGADTELANDVRIYNSRIGGMLTGLARMSGQVGTLTDRDVDAVADMLPVVVPTIDKPFPDNPTVASRKMEEVKQYLNSRGVDVNWDTGDLSPISGQPKKWTDDKYEYKEEVQPDGTIKRFRRPLSN